jgi:hypothetical protein
LRKEFIDLRRAEEGAIFHSSGSIVWKRKRIEKYARAMRAFREHLAALVHMTGGQPARGTELVTVEYKNSVESELRGVFIKDGLMAFVTAYHKNIGATSKAKIIHRYLPREVGELVLYYLWLVVPFWRRVVYIISEGKSSWGSGYIWELVKDKAWEHPRAVKRRRLDDEESYKEGQRSSNRQ